MIALDLPAELAPSTTSTPSTPAAAPKPSRRRLAPRARAIADAARELLDEPGSVLDTARTRADT